MDSLLLWMNWIDPSLLFPSPEGFILYRRHEQFISKEY